MGKSLFFFLFTMVGPGLAWAQRSVEIDLTNQEAYLMEGRRVILESPICSGRPGHETPVGHFRVMGKDLNHASSVYGFFGNPATKQIVVPDADVYMKVPRGLEFVKAPMRYYTQFTPSLGMHAGILPGEPSSHGCVRMPEENAIAFFEQVPVGTPVHVFGHPIAGRQYWASAPSTTPPVTVAPAVARFGWTAADRAFVARAGGGDRDYRESKKAAFNEFNAEWKARERAVDNQIRDLKARRDYAPEFQREAIKERIRYLQDYKDELGLERDAAKEILKQQWGG
jgi:hypothetical protein